ncbi:MAG: DotU/TssL family secretion system protein [Pseudomonadota bacterium]
MSGDRPRGRKKTQFDSPSPLQGRKAQQSGGGQSEGGSLNWNEPAGFGAQDDSSGFDAPTGQPFDDAGPARSRSERVSDARRAGLAPSKLTEDDVPQPSTQLAVRNIMLNEARPMLALFAGLGTGRVDIKLPRLNREAKQMVRDLDRELIKNYEDEETRRRARYAVCVTADDIAQNLPNRLDDGRKWAARSLAIEYFGARDGGRGFWIYADEILADPLRNRDLIELFHACIAAGFRGEHRGGNHHQKIMARLYAAMEHPRSLSQTHLVPEWRGAKVPAGKPAFWTIVLLAAAGAAAFLLLVYLILTLVLASSGSAPKSALGELIPDERLTMTRQAVPVPPVQGQQASQLRRFLSEEIAQGLVKVEEDSQTVRVRTTIGQLFQSGSDELEPGQESLFRQIAAAVEKEPGSVRIEGHSDSDRISPSFRFPDNQALSRARAKVVGDIVSGVLSNPSRVSIEGMGERRPIASNDSDAGKAMNRRVEIIIPRSQSSGS